MQTRVEEREQAEHAPELSQRRTVQLHPQRRDAQRDQQELNDPVARKVRDGFDRVGGQAACESAPDQVSQRDQAQYERDPLGPRVGKIPVLCWLAASSF
jgi:hypothetical protein